MSRGKNLILIVDDNMKNLQLLGKILHEEGYELSAASSGLQALDLAAAHVPDLILLDVNMPQMDGFEACRRLKKMEMCADVPVIFLTARSDAEGLVQGFELGAVDYVTKPFIREELLSRVKHHISFQRNLALLQEEISERKRIEVELLEATHQAEAANVAKSQFLANMSHDIRTPMTAILGFSEILKSTVSNPRQLQQAQTIYNSGLALLQLINSILDLSKVEAGKVELQYGPVDLHNLLHEVRNMFLEPCHTKKIHFKLELANLPASLNLDAGQLRRVLCNLVGNAVKFTDSGKIIVRVDCKSEVDSEKFQLKIIVTDSGIGIPLQEQTRVFEAFDQMRNQSHVKYGGTGLGLSICKKLIELMGGEISLVSEVGKGSVFTLMIPNVEVLSKKQKKSIELDFDFEPARLIIAEDDAMIRELFTSYLEGSSLSVELVEDGAQACAAFDREPADLLLLDYNMPGMDGLTCTRKIRQVNDRVPPIIMISASVMEEQVASVRQEVDEFLPKPFTKSQLLQCISKFLSCKINETKEAEIQGVLFNSLSSPQQKELRNQLASIKAKYPLGDLLLNDLWSYCNDLDLLLGEISCAEVLQWNTQLKQYLNEYEMEAIEQHLLTFPILASN